MRQYEPPSNENDIINEAIIISLNKHEYGISGQSTIKKINSNYVANTPKTEDMMLNYAS